MAKKAIGLDVGSKTITVYAKGEGVIFREANRIALDVTTKQQISYGDEALAIERRLPGSVVLVNPVFEGQISDHEGLRDVLDSIFGELGLTKPDVLLALSDNGGDLEYGAFAEMLYSIGARRVEFINAPTACVLGSGEELGDSRSLITVDIGSGVTDVGLVKGCVTKYEQSVKYGCAKLDAAVAALVKREFNAVVDEEVLEEIREKIGSVHESADGGKVEFPARDVITGLPVTCTLSSAQTRSAMLPIAQYICAVVEALVKNLPAGAAEEVAERGVLISGGGALTAGMDTLLAEKTGLPVRVSPHATDCMIEGAGVVIENRAIFETLINAL